jgi:membrane peptidoglycan carboxypeptidase
MDNNSNNRTLEERERILEEREKLLKLREQRLKDEETFSRYNSLRQQREIDEQNKKSSTNTYNEQTLSSKLEAETRARLQDYERQSTNRARVNTGTGTSTPVGTRSVRTTTGTSNGSTNRVNTSTSRTELPATRARTYESQERSAVRNAVNQSEKENADENVNTPNSKGKHKKKKQKSFIAKVLDHKSETNTVLFIFEFIMAILLDILRILKNIILGVLVIVIIAGIIGGLFVWSKVEPYYTEYKEFATNAVENSTVETFKIDESSYIYDKNGKLLVKLKGNQDSAWLSYEDIPTEAIDAFVAVEDRTFWDNMGIDLKGLVRVGIEAIKTKGDEVHGASTITQQLARNVFLSHEVSIERKAKEMLISLELTKKYTKREIMEFYINDICFANAIYGLEAAANGYFNKSASELSLSQICYLCAIPNSPEYYNPYKYPERALERRDKILGDMKELGLISDTEYREAINEKITIEKPEYEFNDYQSTFAIDCATRYIMEQDGFELRYTFTDSADYKNYKKDYDEAYAGTKASIMSGGYKIYTTLDSDIQEEMQSVLDEQLGFDEEVTEDTGIYALQGAITVVDNSSGKVVALIGGRSQDSNENVYSLNRAYQSTRQPGSTIKPLVVYTPALMNGYTPNTTVYNIDVTKAKEKGTDVQSLRGTSMTLRSALEQSKNGVAWQTFDKFGASYCLSFLNNMRFASICPDDYYDSASLGGLTYGVTTVEMAGAYSTLENHGYYREPTCIDKIINSDGDDIYRESVQKSIYDEAAADTMVDMMTGVLTKGTAAKLNWYKSTKMIAACKTGTTNDSKDGWLCGFTPYYTVSVWVGYDTPRTLNNLYGATYPGQIWKEAMLKLIEDKEVIEEFEKTDNYNEQSNRVIHSEDLPDTAYDLYLPGRSDDEELSSGYTVYDYRSDRVKGESIPVIVSQMYNLDSTSADYINQLYSLYQQGIAVINTVYSQKYKQELTNQLNTAYGQCTGATSAVQ